MSTIPRLVISAPSSGHGKTAISVGLLAALSARGYRAAGFKIGPDHVDAAYLGLAAGRPGRNLDPRMVGAKRMGPLFAHGAASLDIAVVEGTMGLFDGLAGRTDSESTAQISGLLRAPVILVVDVGAMGQSVAALVHGFRAYDELLWLGGVILNRVASTRHEQLLREALDDIGVPVLGALRRHALTDAGEAGAPLPSRHHGVAPVVHHNIDAVRAVRRLGEVIAGAVDIDRTMALARSAPRLTSDPWNAEAEVTAAAESGPSGPAVPRVGRRPIIGVAFAYPETAELLTAAGAEVVPFDPLRDEVLPAGVDGLVIGSALPESYAEELTFNGRLRTAVAAHAAAGKPIAAEGTGLVWLCRDFNGRPMCGVVDASARDTDLVVLGYREATARSSSVLLPAGAQLIGHKMHRSSITPRAGLQAAWTWAGGPAEGFVQRGVHASYLGLHWAGTPSIATRFVAAAGAIAAPTPGQWSTPSTSPYGRPSVPVMNFPTAPVPPTPIAASPVTAVPAASPVTAVPASAPVSSTAPASASAPVSAAAPASASAPASGSAPVSAAPGPNRALSYAADYTTPEPPAPKLPVAIPGSILASPAGPGSIAAGALSAGPPAPATGSYPVVSSSLAGPPQPGPPQPRSEVPSSAPTSPGASSPFGPALGPALPTPWTSLNNPAPAASTSVSAPAPVSSPASALPPASVSVSGSPVSAPASASPSISGSPVSAAASVSVSGSPVSDGVAAGAASPGVVSGAVDQPEGASATRSGADGDGDVSDSSDRPSSPDVSVDEATSVLAVPGTGAAAGGSGEAGEASVGVPSGPNAPAAAPGLPSSGIVPVQFSAQDAASPGDSPSSAGRAPASVTGPITAFGPGSASSASAQVSTASASGLSASVPLSSAPVSSASAPVSSAAASGLSASAPVSSASVSVSSAFVPVPSASAPVSGAAGVAGHVSGEVAGQAGGGAGGGGTATSAAMPISSAPMPEFGAAAPPVTAPVSAAPGGVTAMPAAESELVPAAEEVAGPYASPSHAGTEIAEQAPVSAPPVSAPPSTGVAGAGRSVGTASIPAVPVSGPVATPSGSVVSGSVASSPVSGASSGSRAPVSAPPADDATTVLPATVLPAEGASRDLPANARPAAVLSADGDSGDLPANARPAAVLSADGDSGDLPANVRPATVIPTEGDGRDRPVAGDGRDDGKAGA
ncbi:cobyrinate a,c-diamide synthase [Dactylosporangium matsuzakiense]|uniref:Cobyrinic acid a,c-diamide synthase n=1 Tax=Dactylosporangium matsuzakiense TaxID=53360 RepID=A0A9W6KPG5_9ACTN|nr:cobyrinate a,c-diamide synthase [Dactylosporangium matsuzakiense]GLL05747.1 hypothetical protein GCM10017581_074940 [Dactylosporangium matsuzakiense]